LRDRGLARYVAMDSEDEAEMPHVDRCSSARRGALSLVKKVDRQEESRGF
jgi:hypothetical protein